MGQKYLGGLVYPVKLRETSQTVPRDEQKTLGIRPRENKVVLFKMADGNTTPGVPVVLDSIKVGTAEVRNVRAAIMLERVGEPHEAGLLGMSFLKNFHVKIDTARKKLILESK